MDDRKSIPERYYIKEVVYKENEKWFLKRHYAKVRPAIIIRLFGLYEKETDTEIGICSFSLPISPNYNKENSGKNLFRNEVNGLQGYELSRLCVIEGLEKNTLSFFVSECLNEMKKIYGTCFIVSYADSNQNHSGYIYQATNWLYTGEGSKGAYKWIDKNGKSIHRRTLNEIYPTNQDKIDAGYTPIKQKGKYRYFYFLGSSREVKKMKKAFSYEVLPYPKNENIRYQMDMS